MKYIYSFSFLFLLFLGTAASASPDDSQTPNHNAPYTYNSEDAYKKPHGAPKKSVPAPRLGGRPCRLFPQAHIEEEEDQLDQSEFDAAVQMIVERQNQLGYLGCGSQASSFRF